MPSVYDSMAGVPGDYVLQNFTNFKSLENITEDVLKDLDKNNIQGNQWIVVLGLTQPARALERRRASPWGYPMSNYIGWFCRHS